MKRPLPLYDETAAISCSLAPDEIPARLATIDRIRHEHDHLERTEHGLLLHFPPSADLEAELRRFTLDEKRCCQFWGFEVLADDARAELALRWEAPPSAAELIDRLEVFFTGDEPVEVLGSLL